MAGQVESLGGPVLASGVAREVGRRFGLALSLLLPLACSHDITVFSFTSIHEGVQLIDHGTVTEVARFVEESSTVADGRVVLRPSVAGLKITVEFASVPRVGESVRYAARDPRTGLENRFFVFTGKPDQRVGLTSHAARITRLSDEISDAEISGLLRGNERVRSKYSFAYSIQWNGRELRGRIFMVERVHLERDPLLN